MSELGRAIVLECGWRIYAEISLRMLEKRALTRKAWYTAAGDLLEDILSGRKAA